MANTVTGKPVRSAWTGGKTGLALVVMLLATLVAPAQQPEPPRPPRVRLLMKTAHDHYKRGEYETAATIFAQAQAGQNELSATEQRDLKTFIQQNSTAITSQREGTQQVRQAEDALRQGKTQEAARLVKGLTANQYLSAADRTTLANLNESIRAATASAPKSLEPISAQNDAKSLLAAARTALKRGEFETADAFVNQAEKVGFSWLHAPWSDTPSKVRREIASARKQAAANVTKEATPEKKESAGMFKSLKTFFGGKEDKKDGPVLPENPPVVRGPDLPLVPPDLPGPPPLAKNDLPKVNDPPGPLAKSPEGPPVRQTTYPSTDPNAPPASADATKAQARKYIKDGYKALAVNDLDTARRLASQAKDLRPNLEWWEENPERLLADIQRRAAAKAPAPTAPVQGATVKNTIKPGTPPADPRQMVKEARNLLQLEKFEEAEKLCVQAGTAQPKGWGLFEDSPDKLKNDIQKARTKRDRDEAGRMMVEARKLYSMGNFHEAKVKAYRAQQLHGPYNIWDLGDRPQKLLEEIQRVEAKKDTPPLPPPDIAKAPDPKKNPPAVAQGNAKNDPTIANKAAPPLVPGASQTTTKIRAASLIQQARDLQKKGMLIEARANALEAEQLKVNFGPDEDSPSSVLVSLAAQCERTVDQLLQRATDYVQNHPTDPNRFKRAEEDLSAAKVFAQTFNLDSMRIDQKVQWLRQAAAASGVQPIAAQEHSSAANPLVNAMGSHILPPLGDSVAARNRLLGLEKLDKARLELKAGNLPMARRLTEEAFHQQYAVQEEAAKVLRSIDADEHNHKVNMANRNADAGFDAFARKDFRTAASIFAALDMRMVQPDKARRIGEVMNLPEMQPQTIQLVDAKGPDAKNNPSSKPGVATATDLIGDDMKNFRAMEEIQVQQMRDRGLIAEKTALELFKTGQKARAVEVLKEYVDQVNASQLDPQRQALLKARVETRIQQYRTVLAQDTIENQVTKISSNKWDEGAFQKNKRKTQEDVAELIKQYRMLHREGKFQEALAAARKAKELDPDNLSADAAIQITTIKIAQDNYNKGKAQNENMFLNELNPGNGPYVNMENPLHHNPEMIKRHQARENGNKGFKSQTRDPVERAIERRLSEPITVSFKDRALHEVIHDLHIMSGINIVPDRTALQEANISLDMPLTLSVENISMKSALNILLDQVKLTHVTKDQVLQITTHQNAKGRLQMVTYPIADLVVPVDNHPTRDINSMSAALTRHLGGASGMINNTASPYTTPLSLPGGQSVSSHNSGNGSTFASNPNGVSPAMPQTRAPGQTLEDLLINLITNTVSQNTWGAVGGPGTIQYFPLGMALVVNQTQEVQEEVAALLASLRRLQDLEVAIEMRLVSVSENFFERIGVDFDVNLRTGTSRREVDLVNGQFTPFGFVNRNLDRLNLVSGLTPAGTLTPDLNIPIKNSSFDFSIPPFGGYPGTLGADGGLSLGLAFLSDIQVFMFLEAAQGDRRMNVMQAPKITVFNGQTATITVNDQQFFLTNVTLNQANGQIFFTPNNQPFPLGVNLTVTPVVSADRRFVRLNLTPTLTNLANATVPLIPVQIPVPQLLEGPGNANSTVGQPVIFQMFFQQPTFTTISIDTTVNVPDGGTVLLGGLKTMSEGRNEFGPPVLSKIPYLSRLFKNVAYGREGQSLMIMVTPRIIINEEEEQIFLGNLPPIPR